MLGVRRLPFFCFFSSQWQLMFGWSFAWSCGCVMVGYICSSEREFFYAVRVCMQRDSV